MDGLVGAKVPMSFSNLLRSNMKLLDITATIVVCIVIVIRVFLSSLSSLAPAYSVCFVILKAAQPQKNCGRSWCRS